jgi:hypothetical protein
MNKTILLFVMLAVTALSAFAPDFSLRPGGFVFSPRGRVMRQRTVMNASALAAAGNRVFGEGAEG